MKKWSTAFFCMSFHLETCSLLEMISFEYLQPFLPILLYICRALDIKSGRHNAMHTQNGLFMCSYRDVNSWKFFHLKISSSMRFRRIILGPTSTLCLSLAQIRKAQESCGFPACSCILVSRSASWSLIVLIILATWWSSDASPSSGYHSDTWFLWRSRDLLTGRLQGRIKRVVSFMMEGLKGPTLGDCLFVSILSLVSFHTLWWALPTRAKVLIL